MFPFSNLARCLAVNALLISCLFTVTAQARERDARLTAGVPVHVWHHKERPISAGRGWNEGWLNNEGVFIDLSWPVWRLGENTAIRAGFTGGGFDNSVFDTSLFFGGMAEIEHHATERLAFGFGTYAGVLNGYDDGTGPGAAPYISTSYATTEKLELGLRGFWLPASTVAGEELAPSDAYVTAFTVGTRF